jgi:hypothetical protein
MKIIFLNLKKLISHPRCKKIILEIHFYDKILYKHLKIFGRLNMDIKNIKEMFKKNEESKSSIVKSDVIINTKGYVLEIIRKICVRNDNKI